MEFRVYQGLYAMEWSRGDRRIVHKAESNRWKE